MKFLKLLIILLMVITVTNAKHEGQFNVDDIERSGDFFEIDTLSVKYSLDFLMGEIVLRANAKYTLGNYITIDGNVHKMDEFPAEVQDKLRLTELKVETGVVSGSGVPNMYVEMDLGAMGKPNEWSYNTAGSPDWNKFIYDSSSNYLGKEPTIKAMKQFRRFGLGANLSLAKTTAIGYDVSAARDYILKQKRDAEKNGKQVKKEIKKTTEIKEKKKYTGLMMDILDEMGKEEYNQTPYKTKTTKIAQLAKTSVGIKGTSINEKNSISSNKTKKINVPKPNREIANTSSSKPGKSGKAWYDAIEIQNTQWSIHYSYNKKDGRMSIGTNNVNVQYMYNGKKDLLWKYTILDNPRKNCWVLTGPKSFKYGKAFGKEKYYLIYDVFDKQAVIVPYSLGYEKAKEFSRKPANYYFKLIP